MWTFVGHVIPRVEQTPKYLEHNTVVTMKSTIFKRRIIRHRSMNGFTKGKVKQWFDKINTIPWYSAKCIFEEQDK